MEVHEVDDYPKEYVVHDDDADAADEKSKGPGGDPAEAMFNDVNGVADEVGPGWVDEVAAWPTDDDSATLPATDLRSRAQTRLLTTFLRLLPRTSI